jgi:hypothetical protein
MVTLTPQVAEEKKEEKKEKKKDIQTETTFDYEKTSLDDKSKEQLKYFMQIKPLIKKINAMQGPDRNGKIFRRRISKLLKKAAEISTEEAQREYLDALAAGVKSNDFDSSSSKWLNGSGYKVDIIIKPRPGKKTRALDMYVMLKHTEYTEKARKYISILDKMVENIPVREDLAPFDISLISPIIVSEVVFSSRPDQFILVFPDNPAKDKPNEFKIVIFSNILASYFKKFIEPLAKQVFSKTVAEAVDFDSYLSNIILHRLSFYLGPIFIAQQGDGVVLIKDRLKNMFYYVEDIRAEAAAISNIQVLIDEKMIKEELKKNIYSTYVVSLLRRIILDPKGKTAMPALFQFNQLLKSGGITFDINTKKLGIDKKQLGNGVRRLTLMAAQYEKAGNYEEIERLIKGVATNPSDELKELFENLKKEPGKAHIKKAKTLKNKTTGEEEKKRY